MARRRFAFIVAACFFCALGAIDSGCGSNSSTKEQRVEAPASSTPAAAPAPAPPQPQDNRPVIVAFGDSLTAGVAGRSYPDDLQDLLDEHGYHYRVENQGVSGDTTTDGLARIENVITEHPALVLLEFGGNDGLRGIPVEATRKNLEEMIVRLKQANIPIVLLGITLPPNYGSDYIKPFTAMYPELAKKYKLVFMPFLLVHVYKTPGMMQPDGIHPSGEGNKIVARDVFDLVKPLLKR
ncbi:MAG TPA: arylesterase [Bryobacteraceae bacterium]|nr:arylesterase [Bryobacteraceae bacterium]